MEVCIFRCTCGLEKLDSYNPIGHKLIDSEWNKRRLCARRCDGGWSRRPRLPFRGYNEQWVSCAVVHRGSWAQASPWRCSRSRDRNTSIGRSRLPPVSFRYFTFDHNTPGGKLSRQPRSWLLSPSFHVTALADQYMCIFTALQTSWRCFAVENLDSATFKMFLRKRSNIPASSLSTPKPKKSVSNQFLSHQTLFMFSFLLIMWAEVKKKKRLQYEATALQCRNFYLFIGGNFIDSALTFQSVAVLRLVSRRACLICYSKRKINESQSRQETRTLIALSDVIKTFCDNFVQLKAKRVNEIQI